MQVTRLEDNLQLTLSTLECALLLHALRGIQKNYQINPTELDGPTARAWYSPRGCQSAGMTPEETEEWMAHLFQLRTQNLKAIQIWIRQLNRPLGPPFQLVLPLSQAPILMTVINDHRLLQAARHSLGEAEMTLEISNSLESLSSDKRRALCEIHLLAYLIEAILHHLQGSADDPGNT